MQGVLLRTPLAALDAPFADPVGALLHPLLHLGLQLFRLGLLLGREEAEHLLAHPRAKHRAVGFNGGPTRPPRLPLNPAERAALDEALSVNIAAAPPITEQGLKFLVRNFPTGGMLVSNGLRLIKDVLERGSAGEEELTPREEEIVKLVAEAHTTKEIAELLHLSEKTVENHRANAMRKLGMRDRVELVRYAIRRGLIEP